MGVVPLVAARVHEQLLTRARRPEPSSWCNRPQELRRRPPFCDVERHHREVGDESFRGEPCRNGWMRRQARNELTHNRVGLRQWRQIDIRGLYKRTLGALRHGRLRSGGRHAHGRGRCGPSLRREVPDSASDNDRCDDRRRPHCVVRRTRWRRRDGASPERSSSRSFRSITRSVYASRPPSGVNRLHTV